MKTLISTCGLFMLLLALALPLYAQDEGEGSDEHQANGRYAPNKFFIREEPF